MSISYCSDFALFLKFIVQYLTQVVFYEEEIRIVRLHFPDDNPLAHWGMALLWMKGN